MYIKFKKTTDQLVQITDISDGIPFPNPYFKFTEENLPEQSLQWFSFLNNCIFVVIEIVGDSPKFAKYYKYMQKAPEPALEIKKHETTVKHVEKQKEDKKQEEFKEVKMQKIEAEKEQAKAKSGGRRKKVISDQKEIEDKVKKFLS